MEGDYKRLSDDIVMLTTMAFPDDEKGSREADALMEQCRRVAAPSYVAQRIRREL
jgi:hypothetical protein